MRQRPGGMLSADNSYPERHIVIETLRQAAPLLGLKAPVIATLEAMLSCLAPKRSHHTVFASNATLAHRLNGLSDRTIRRHAATLQEHGLLQRHDSPNKKRFTRHSPGEGMSLRFGFDLSPLFARLPELTRLAAAATSLKERLAYARCKLRSAVQRVLADTPDDPQALATLKHLRRKLTLADCEALLTGIQQIPAEGPLDRDATPAMSTKDGQNVRHQHKSKEELTEKKSAESQSAQRQALQPGDLTVPDLLAACPEAAEYAVSAIRTTDDVIAHARTLAPMVGIDAANYSAAQDRLGPLGTAVTVWAMLGLHDQIHRVGAYFRALTSGAKSVNFDPFTLVRRLLRRQMASTAPA